MKINFKICRETFDICVQNRLKNLRENDWKEMDRSGKSKMKVVDDRNECYEIQLTGKMKTFIDPKNAIGAFCSHLIKNPELVSGIKFSN